MKKLTENHKKLKQWCRRHGGYNRAADILGIHVNTLRNYVHGRQDIPPYVNYATVGFDCAVISKMMKKLLDDSDIINVI